MNRDQVEELLGYPVADWQWEVISKYQAGENPPILSLGTRYGRSELLQRWLDILRVLGYRIEEKGHGCFLIKEPE